MQALFRHPCYEGHHPPTYCTKQRRIVTCGQICQEPVNQEQTSSRQGCQTDRSSLKPSSGASLKVNYWQLADGQGVKKPSPDIFACGPSVSSSSSLLSSLFRAQSLPVLCTVKKGYILDASTSCIVCRTKNATKYYSRHTCILRVGSYHTSNMT